MRHNHLVFTFSAIKPAVVMKTSEKLKHIWSFQCRPDDSIWHIFTAGLRVEKGAGIIGCLPLVNELVVFIVPIVQRFRMSGSQALNGCHSSKFNTNKLMSNPQCGGKIDVKANSFADTGRNVIFADAEVNSWLEAVDVGERKTVTDEIFHYKIKGLWKLDSTNLETFAAFLIFLEVALPQWIVWIVFTKTKILPIFSSPSDCRSTKKT